MPAQKIALLWAGTLLGGNLLAAPAKFQVDDLSLPLALQVGRVQFLWVWYAELGFLLLLVSLTGYRFAARSKHPLQFHLHSWLWISVVIVFAIQHLGFMPLLQARSEQIIAGQPPSHSSLHLIYVGLEGAKFLLLLAAGFYRESSLKTQP